VQDLDGKPGLKPLTRLAMPALREACIILGIEPQHATADDEALDARLALLERGTEDADVFLSQGLSFPSDRLAHAYGLLGGVVHLLAGKSRWEHALRVGELPSGYFLDGGVAFQVNGLVFARIIHTWPDPTSQPSDYTDMTVAIFADTNHDAAQQRLIVAVDVLVTLAGFVGPLDEEVLRGSIFRRSRARARALLTSEQVVDRLASVERALELAALDLPQARVDQLSAQSAATLLAEMHDVPRVAVRLGAILLIKFTDASGPVILLRSLTPREVRALEHYPLMQMHPERLLDMLAMAIEAETSDNPAPADLRSRPDETDPR
jgi:hypothetical protein